jgi:cytochrome o ubiquinol oxidase subunit 2
MPAAPVALHQPRECGDAGVKASIIIACVVPLCACRSGVMYPRGPVGSAELTILTDATLIMLAVIVPVIVCTLAFAWWFRRSNTRAHRRLDWSYSGRLELLIWSIPALVIFFLGGIAWVGAHLLDPRAPLRSEVDPIDVEVVSLDWKWLFIYPREGIASVNRLVVPAGTPLRFQLTSASVMNSFFVPQLGSQIYTMAGMTTGLNLQADSPGSYPGLSAQFSGDGFSDMRFDVVAVPVAAFSQWASGIRKSGGVLDATAYAVLSRPSHRDIPSTFGSVDSELFQRIVASPGAAPEATHNPSNSKPPP